MIGDGDLETIFESGDFDVIAVFTISTGTTLSVHGWFTDSTEQTNPLTSQVEAVLPTFDCKSSELDQPGTVVRKGMGVTVGGGTYTVERLQVNGTGVTTVYLKT